MTPQETEAIVIIKAAPQVGEKHGETVCCAGIDLKGHWLRLYPVPFRDLEKKKQFRRWDRIKFEYLMPKNDSRCESRHLNPDSLEIVGKLAKKERGNFLDKFIVTSLDKELKQNRSLALLEAEIIDFKVKKKSKEDIQKQREQFSKSREQQDFFRKKTNKAYTPCPYEFKYNYRTEDGKREGTCQDWEIDATYYNWANQYGEIGALDKMKKVFGEDYPSKGMLLAMGTHSQYPDTWLINGIVRLDKVKQPSLPF